MRIVIISNGHSINTEGVNVSGGDVRWIEIARRWAEKQHEIHVYTTNSGRDLCSKLGFNAEFSILETGSTKSNTLNYFLRAIKSTFCIPNSLIKLDPDIIYSVTEHYYDVIPAVILKRKTKASWTSVVHWVATINRQGTIFDNLLFLLQQRVGIFFIKRFSDHVLAVSNSTRTDLLRLGLRNNIHTVACGVDYHRINMVLSEDPYAEKIYDAVFMKRFHSAKGIFDLIDIWARVVEKKPSSKLLIIGGGSNEVVEDVKQLIIKRGLQNNIELSGTVYDFTKKIKLLQKSRLFVLPSYEENWAIVIGEALACGLPVICYELPEIVPIWKNSVVWVTKGDIALFAATVLKLLSSPDNMKTLSEYGTNYVKQYNWDNISANELSVAVK